MVWKTTLLTVLTGLLSIGCTTAQMSIHSYPSKAQVWAAPLGGAKLELIGETPLHLTSRELSKRYPGVGAFVVELRRDDFLTETIYITEVSKVDLIIKKEMRPTVAWDDTKKLNHTIESLFEVRRLVEIKKYEHALTLLQDLKREFPHVSTIYELEGSIFLIKGAYWPALSSYRKAAKYNPQNLSISSAIRELERVLKVKPEGGIDELTRLPAKVEPQPEGGGEQ